MDRALNRVFSKVHAATKEKLPVEADEDPDDAAPLEVADIILKHISERQYFSCFDLPQPRFNALGKPTWDVTDSELSKAFRKKSLRIHPDKNPDPRAREAFDGLNDLYQILQDPVKRGEWVREAAERAKRMEKSSWNPADDVETEIQKLSAHAEEKSKLKKEEVDDFAAQIAEQIKQKRMRAKYKSACVRASKYNGTEADDSDSDDEERKPKKEAVKEEKEDSDEERERRSAKMRANAKRKKPKLIM